MKPVSTKEFHDRHGRLLLYGSIYEFETYREYLEVLEYLNSKHGN